MGQKVNPNLFRLGFNKVWSSKWFSKKDFSKILEEDVLIREFLFKKLKDGSVASIDIERFGNKININLHTSKPGIVIGRGGEGIERLKKEIFEKFFKNKKTALNINIQEVERPNLNARIVANQIVMDIEKRMPYRRVMKQALQRMEKAGARGAKVIIKGRLDGAEIARKETLTFGKIPLHTLRSDIDYSPARASTTYGAIGVKVWIYRGVVFQNQEDKSSIKIGK